VDDAVAVYENQQRLVALLAHRGIIASTIDGVVTLDSCEFNAMFREASVYFKYGTHWQDLADLVARLACVLRTLNLCCGCSVSVEWLGSNDQPRALLLVKPEHVADVAAAIKPDSLAAVCLR
jgi:hypothetical protein